MATTMTAPRCGWRVLVGTLVCATALASGAAAQDGTDGQWRVHGGDSGYTRYAPLDQINADTVNDLEIAWRRSAVDATLHDRWPELFSNSPHTTPIVE